MNQGEISYEMLYTAICPKNTTKVRLGNIYSMLFTFFPGLSVVCHSEAVEGTCELRLNHRSNFNDYAVSKLEQTCALFLLAVALYNH